MIFSEFDDIFHTIMALNNLSAYVNDVNSRKFFDLTIHLLDVSKVMNLTAIKEERAIILRHYADSLTVADLLPQNAKIVDIGCGAGFPCLPLAICRPDLHITAIDSTEKRIRYVNDTAKMLKLPNVSGVSLRAEEGGKGIYRESFDVALARAVAELPVLSELCLPYVRPKGRFLAMKATRAEEEVERSRAGISRLGGKIRAIHEILLRGTDEEDARAIIDIEKVSRTPIEFPRSFARILKKPL